MIDVIWQAQFQQAVSRCVIEAFSRPGKINALPEWATHLKRDKQQGLTVRPEPFACAQESLVEGCTVNPLMVRQAHHERINFKPSHLTALAVLATLVDGESSLADPHQLLDNSHWLRLQIKPVAPELAAFILCQGTRPVDFEPNPGTLASPEQGATLVLTLAALSGGDPRYQLTGPGIESTIQIAPQGLDVSWLKQRAGWNSAFPLGVDMLLATDEGVLALPRTTQIKEIN